MVIVPLCDTICISIQVGEIMESYHTIKENGNFEIEIKKSRFICHLKRTDNEDEAREFIDQIKKEHWKATHNCSAYTIGMNDEIQRAHDDGEPSGTAGVPMLEILKKRELKNVTAVVTRYFGGTKLGAGGLIHAYSGSVNDAIRDLGVVKRQLLQAIDLTVSYPLSGQVENLLRESDFLLNDIEYTENVTFKCFVEPDQLESFQEQATEWTNGQGQFETGPNAYIEREITNLS